MEEENKSIIEEQMEWLQQTYPKVFGQKMSSIVESTLRRVAEQSKGEAFKEIFDIGHNNDCMFCGFKDRKCREFLSHTPPETG